MTTNRPLRVFLCHSSADKPAVRELYQKLSAEPWIDPWLDEEDIFPGDDWNLEIQKAIRDTDVVVVCLSTGSITKEGYVQREIKAALDYADEKPERTVYIIPIRLEECIPPDRLSKWHYIDYFEDNRERALERLLVSFQRRAESLGLSFEMLGTPELRTQEEELAQKQNIDFFSFGINSYHYETIGRGRPVIFLHSWVGSSTYWYPTMQMISGYFKSYAIDFWGYGASSKRTKMYSLESQLNSFSLFFDELGLSKAAIVGHGFGALIGMQFAEKHPEKVDRIMAISCPLYGDAINPRMKNYNVEKLMEFLYPYELPPDIEVSDFLKSDEEAILTALNSSKINVFSPKKKMTSMVLFVNNANDPAIQFPIEGFLDQLPLNYGQITLEDTGHFPMLQTPAKFNDILLKFLLLDSGASPREIIY